MSVVLRTFQRLARVEQLDADGLLVGDWDRVIPQHARAYRAMVDAMARHGVDTGGRPPIWAWTGEVRLVDAALLLDAEHELSTGYATVEFEAPAELVVSSDYGAWNDYLEALFHDRSYEWQPGGADQACLPYLRAEWVREVRPLPTSGWDELDLSLPA
ncbi:hypothetical protein [Pseudonocardia acaciae]|uniref:hypothetical protein n=1 Tax=Pseudonocardia acaciae TaxID=551276 RepID=UPI00048DB264|nr:hypothetical protein [Pseudonocardia acaciae]